MLLELALGHQEKHDEIDGLVVESIKIDTRAGAAQRADHFGYQVRGGVRDTDTEADAGAHRCLALLDHRDDRFPVLGANLAGRHQVINQLVYRFPAIGSPQISDDLLSA